MCCINREAASTMFSLSSFEDRSVSLFSPPPLPPSCLYRPFQPRDLVRKHFQPTQLKLVFHLQSDLTLRGSQCSTALEKSERLQRLFGSRSPPHFTAEICTKCRVWGGFRVSLFMFASQGGGAGVGALWQRWEHPCLVTNKHQTRAFVP